MRTALILAFTLSLPFTVRAQDPIAPLPFSMRTGLGFTDVPTVQAPPFDAEAAAISDAARAEAGALYLYGRFLPLQVDPVLSGVWRTLPNGDGLWRMRIVSAGALATELFFRNVDLPAGATIHVYQPGQQEPAYALTAADISVSGHLSGPMVYGDASIVEYHEPMAVRGQGRFTITRLAHAYRGIGQIKSDPCEVDVNCSEGLGWEDQRDAVVRIRVVGPEGNGWCTGTLMNNTAQDCRPYILTALHCGEGSTTADFEDYLFRFNYQRSGCATGTSPSPTPNTVTGCVRRADSNDGGGNSGSDFLLVEMNNEPTPAMNAYYAGWDATTTASQGGRGIHHPDSDVKKISTYDSQVYSAGWGISNTHWRVQWVATANGHGVTEPGSSGSPLFNNAKRLVGTLTGGFSCCTTNGCGPSTGLAQPDYYGKMSYHWSSNPNSATEKLREWLAPNSTATTLDGSENPCGVIGIEERAVADAPTIFPNPSTGRFTVQWSAGMGRTVQVEVLDIAGRVVEVSRPDATGSVIVDGSAWAPGTYFISTVADGVRSAAGKTSIER